MRIIKSFASFIKESGPQTAPSPTRPAPKPSTKPGTPKPTTKPNRPSPIRRDKPGVEPGIKLKKSSADEVANIFIEEMNNKGESISDLIKNIKK